MLLDFGSNNKVTSISGPCSLYLLINELGPNHGKMKYLMDKFMSKGETFCFPMIILLGDYHSNSGFQCKSCKCCKTDDCCTKIYEDKFFLILDELAERTKASIKIFIESMMPLEQLQNDSIKDFEKEYYIQSGDVGLIEKLKYEFEPCFSYKHKLTTELVESTKMKCKAKHLKWTYGDPRSINYKNVHEKLIYEAVIYASVQHIIFYSEYYKKDKLSVAELLDLLNHLQNQLFPNVVDLDYVQTLMYELFRHLELLYDVNNAKEYIALLFNKNNEFSKLSFNLRKIGKNEEEWGKLILDYFHEIIIKNALVNEINNVQPEPIVESEEFKKWINFTIEVYEACYSYSCIFGSIANFIHRLKTEKRVVEEDKAKVFDIIGPKTSLISGFPFMQVHTIFTSFFVDMNLLLEIIKNNTEDMIVAYMGNSHCENLSLACSKIFGYQRILELQNDIRFVYNPEIKKMVPANLSFRCINLQSRLKNEINIESLIYNHKKDRERT
jgi:hypothetical protein